MSIATTPHVNFRGQAREALAFYQSVFGGETSIATYQDIHAADGGADPDHIAFGRVDAPNGFSIMAYDVQPSKAYDPGQNSFYITLHGTDGDEIQPLWNALAASASDILTPLAPAPFAPLYGMLTDRYNITWIVGADTAPAAG
jgi:PhnB protein